jgi:hypothetical protein
MAQIIGNCPGAGDIYTGQSECSVVPDVPAMVLIADANYAGIPYGTGVSNPAKPLVDVINTEILAGNLVPIWVNDSTDTGGDIKTRTQGDVQRSIGYNQKVTDFVVKDADYCIFDELVALNGKNVQVFIVYRNELFEARRVPVMGATDGTFINGYSASLFVTETNTTADGYNIDFQVTYSINYPAQRKDRFTIPVDYTAIMGIIGVQLTTSDSNSNETHITSCGGVDVGIKNPTAWSNPELYIGKNTTTGAVIVATAATVDPATGKLSLTYPTTGGAIQLWRIEPAVALASAEPTLKGYGGRNVYAMVSSVGA